jgi:hypothetical protein
MSVEPHPDWKHIDKTSNADVYQVSEELIAIIPFPDSRDTEETARESLAAQNKHWTKLGHGGGVAIYMDPVIEQEGNARKVYMDESAVTGTACFALIAETDFSAGASAVFTGLARPAVPLRIFRSLEDAMPWIRETIETAS